MSAVVEVRLRSIRPPEGSPSAPQRRIAARIDVPSRPFLEVRDDRAHGSSTYKILVLEVRESWPRRNPKNRAEGLGNCASVRSVGCASRKRCHCVCCLHKSAPCNLISHSSLPEARAVCVVRVSVCAPFFARLAQRVQQLGESRVRRPPLEKHSAVEMLTAQGALVAPVAGLLSTL